MRSLWLIIASVFLIVTFACAPKPPAPEKVVAYLSLADYTGPIAGLNVPADMGCEDYFKELNAKGGVDGVKVKFIPVDTRYDTSRAISAYKRYRTEPKLLVTNAIKTDVAKALAPIFEKDKMVSLAAGAGEFQAKIGRTFIWGECYQNAFAGALDWMVADWKAKGKPGTPKIGYLSWDTAYGWEAYKLGGMQYAEKMGYSLLPGEYFPPGTLKHDVWLKRLAEAGANYIYIGGVDPTPTNIVRDAYALGLTKTIQFVTDYWGPTALGVSTHAEALEGTVITSYFIRGEEAFKHPLGELAKKYRGKPLSELNEVYVVGMSWALDYEAALKIALKEVGYEKLDSEAMYRAYQKLTGGGHRQGMTGPCTYDAKTRRGADLIKFYQVKAGKIVAITDWRKAPDVVGLVKW